MIQQNNKKIYRQNLKNQKQSLNSLQKYRRHHLNDAFIEINQDQFNQYQDESRYTNIRNSSLNNRVIGKSAKFYNPKHNRSKQGTVKSYSQKVLQQFNPKDDTRNKDNQTIRKQILSMRERLQQINQALSDKIYRFQLLENASKGMSINKQTEDHLQILTLQRQNGQKLIYSQEKQIEQIQLKLRQLTQKDYELELQQQIILMQKNIKSLVKQINKKQTAQKINSKIIDQKNSQIEDEFKNIKLTKQSILYYYKKHEQNQNIIIDLDQKYKRIHKKEEQISKEYNKYMKIAVQRNLIVTSNKNYIENKKIQDQTQQKLNKIKKNIELCKKTKQNQLQRLSKQVQYLKGQILTTNNEIQQTQRINKGIIKQTQGFIDKNKVTKMMIKKISYKFLDFPQYTLKNSRQKTIQSFQKKVEQKRPKLKLSMNLSNNQSYNISSQKIQANTPRYISQRCATENNNENFKKNDYNTIRQHSKNTQFRIKPSMIVKKREDFSMNSQKIQQNSFEDKTEFKDIEVNYKNRRIFKIVPVKADQDSN